MRNLSRKTDRNNFDCSQLVNFFSGNFLPLLAIQINKQEQSVNHLPTYLFHGQPKTCYLNSFEGNNLIYEQFIMKERCVHTILILRSGQAVKKMYCYLKGYFGCYYIVLLPIFDILILILFFLYFFQNYIICFGCLFGQFPENCRRCNKYQR